MPIRKHTVTAEIRGGLGFIAWGIPATPLDVSACTEFSIDDDRSPRVTCTLECAIPADLSIISTASAKSVFLYFTTEFIDPAATAKTRQFRLYIQSREIDYINGVVRLSLVSAEYVVQGYAHLGVSRLVYPSWESAPALAQKVTTFPSYITNLFSENNISTIADDTVPDLGLRTKTDWQKPGQSVWDFIYEFINSHALRLYSVGDSPNLKLSTAPHVEPGQIVLDSTNLVEYVEIENRDESFSAVQLTYTADGGDSYQYAGTPDYWTRVYTDTIEGENPGGQAARSILFRSQRRAQKTEPVALLDVSHDTGRFVKITPPAGVTKTALCTAVSFDFKAGTATYTCRPANDIDERCWLTQPINQTWNDYDVTVKVQDL